MMERKNASLNKGKQEAMERRAAKNGALTKALCDYASYPYGGDRWRKLDAELTGLYGKALQDLKTVEEFWNPKLKRAVAALTDRRFAQDMEEITRMRMEGQFSSSMWRRSYRSSDFGYHAVRAVADLAGCLHLETYDQDVKELLTCAHDWVRGFDVRLALELRRGNEEICALVWDAMTGENTEVLLSTPIIRAVIISGREELVDQLLKLLLAARLQEGLRQQILENADAGSVQTLTRILKLCIDEDLFRYSSVTRAFDTWTGLGYGDADGRAVKKCAALAYDCLTDAEARKRYLNSSNTLEAYFALWGMGCMEVADTDRMVRLLLDDGEKYRRILGWLFVSRTDSSRYKMRLAGEYLNERDEETLAWITGCLSVTASVFNTWAYRKEPFTPEKNPDFPEEKEKRRRLFYALKETAAFIGNKNRIKAETVAAGFGFGNFPVNKTFENSRSFRILGQSQRQTTRKMSLAPAGRIFCQNIFQFRQKFIHALVKIAVRRITCGKNSRPPVQCIDTQTGIVRQTRQSR
mgnify:CR=1 FL=1